MRTVPLAVLRILIGVLAVLFAYALGRMIARLHRAQQPYRKALTWFLRTGVCLFALIWVGRVDLTSIVFIALCLASFGGGFYQEWRPKHTEEVHLFNE